MSLKEVHVCILPLLLGARGWQRSVSLRLVETEVLLREKMHDTVVSP